MICRTGPIGLALVVLFTAGAVQAHGANRVPGLDVSRFEFDPGAQDSLVMHAGAFLTEGSTRIGILGQYNQGTAITRVGDGYGNLRLGSRALAHVTVAHALTTFLQAELQLPFIMYQEEGASFSDGHVAEVARSGFATPLATLRFGILRQADGRPLNLSFSATSGIPVGHAVALGRDRRPPLRGALALGRDFGFARVGGLVELRLKAQENFARHGLSSNLEDTVGHELRFGVSGLRQFTPGLSGEVGVLTDVALFNAGVSVQPFAGVRFALARDLELFAGGGPAFGSLSGTAQFRAIAGLAFGRGVQ